MASCVPETVCYLVIPVSLRKRIYNSMLQSTAWTLKFSPTNSLPCVTNSKLQVLNWKYESLQSWCKGSTMSEGVWKEKPLWIIGSFPSLSPARNTGRTFCLLSLAQLKCTQMFGWGKVKKEFLSFFASAYSAKWDSHFKNCGWLNGALSLICLEVFALIALSIKVYYGIILHCGLTFSSKSNLRVFY